MAAGRGDDNLHGDRPRHHQIGTLGERLWTLRPHRGLQARQFGQTVGIGDPPGTALSVVHTGHRLVDHGVEDLLGRPVDGLVTDPESVDEVPLGFVRPERIDTIPADLQPCRRHPLLTTLEALFDPPDQ